MYIMTGADPRDGKWATHHKTLDEVIASLKEDLLEDVKDFVEEGGFKTVDEASEAGDWDAVNAIEFAELLEGRGAPATFNHLESALRAWRSTDPNATIEIFESR